jgi:hypothetical protein
MHREVVKKRGTRDYVAWLDSNQWPRTTVYEQIADWLASQEYYTLPVETLPDEVNPREQAIKQAIEEARNARLGRGRAPKPELEGHVRIPWPVLFAMRDEIDLFREAWRTNEAKVAEILLDAFQPRGVLQIQTFLGGWSATRRLFSARHLLAGESEYCGVIAISPVKHSILVGHILRSPLLRKWPLTY